MTVEMTCGEYSVVDYGSSKTLTANFVRPDDVQVDGKRLLMAALEAYPPAELIDSLCDIYGKAEIMETLEEVLWEVRDGTDKERPCKRSDSQGG